MKNAYTALLLLGAATACALLWAPSAAAQLNRSYDGVDNNLAHPEWGAAEEPLVRWADACYADGISAPAGAAWAGPRVVSNELFDQPLPLADATGLSDYCWVFAQFLDHDITLAPDGPEFAPIAVPADDPLFDPNGTGAVIIPMHRSRSVAGTGTAVGNPREHFNEITAFIDGSNVYGSDAQRAAWLRTFTDGKLKTSPGDLLPYNTLDGSLDTDVDPGAPAMDNPLPFHSKVFVAGDVRANENPLLAAMHTVFVREHNRLCDVLLARDPGLSDEEVYQRARKLNGAILQSIVYNEWLPAMGVALPAYTGYDEQADPSIANEFSAAAFRLGHTLLNANLRRLNPDGSVHPLGHLGLRDAYFNPTAIEATGGIDPFVKGMAEQTQQSFDAHVIDDVRNFLFGRPGAGGLDLASININRGRERGLPDFNTLRAALGLTRMTAWSELTPHAALETTLAGLYDSPDSLDAWVGMLAEDPMPGKLFGATVNAAMERQFLALRDGDRYFYLNDPALSSDDCGIVGSTRLADVLRRNTDVEIMQGNVFTSMLHDSIPACGAADAVADLQVTVTLPTGAALPGALARVYGLDDDMPQGLTDAAGAATLTALPTCDDYGVDAVAGTDPMVGVGSYDLYLIGQHILGNLPLTDAYKLLAADVNRSGAITGFDLSNLRRVALGLDSTFRGEGPWRVFDARFVPGPGDDPLTFAYRPKVHLDLFDGATDANLIAVKVGDVDQTFDPLAPRLQPRSTLAVDGRAEGTTLRLRLPTQLVAAEYTLEAPADNAIVAVDGLAPESYVLHEGGKRVALLDFVYEEDGLSEVVFAFAKPIAAQELPTLSPGAVGHTAGGVAHALQLRTRLVQHGGEAMAGTTTLSPNPFAVATRVHVADAYVDNGHDFVLHDALGREVYRAAITAARLEVQRAALQTPIGGQLTWSVEADGQLRESGIVQLVARP